MPRISHIRATHFLRATGAAQQSSWLSDDNDQAIERIAGWLPFGQRCASTNKPTASMPQKIIAKILPLILRCGSCRLEEPLTWINDNRAHFSNIAICDTKSARRASATAGSDTKELHADHRIPRSRKRHALYQSLNNALSIRADISWTNFFGDRSW